MKYIADLHIHSRYSRATSKDLIPENLHLWGQIKGIQVIGTGDFVHPGWLKELEEKLEPAEQGFFKLKKKYVVGVEEKLPEKCRSDVRFVLSAEISNIYKKNDKVRKIHNIIFAPSFKAAKNIQSKLDVIGNIKSDGRPILGLDARNLLEIVLESDKKSFLIPAHIWTPWFSVLGSKSGFDSIEECYEDLSNHVFAVETGLSSDPLMNWRLSKLDKYLLVSNSDAHSSSKLGREANLFDTDFSYNGMYDSLIDRKNKGFLGTIEFFPEEGKYHYDGHRDCKVRLTPKETIRQKGLCPVCGKPVTVGVMNRVEELADREEGFKPENYRPFESLIPLVEIIAESKNIKSTASKAILTEYSKLINRLGNEFYILRKAPIREIEKESGDMIAEAIKRVRNKNVEIVAGYDGEFGTVKIFTEEERSLIKGQINLLKQGTHA